MDNCEITNLLSQNLDVIGFFAIFADIITNNKTIGNMKQVFLSLLLMFAPIGANAAVGDIFTANTNGFNIRFKIISTSEVMLYGEYSDNAANDEQDYWVNEWSSCLVDYNKRTEDDDGNLLTYCRYQGPVSIPETILNPNDGHIYAITRIGEYAFGHADGITSVTLPSTITEISAHAFEFCSSLPTLNIPESVTTIGDYAFYESGLSTIDIPTGISYLGEGAFRSCNLSSVIIPPAITEIKDFLFFDCSNLTEVTLGSDVTSIGKTSFGNTGLTSIVIPESVSTIDEYAFANCKSLTDVYCLPQEIPTTQTNSFMSSNLGNATLHVPEALIEFYILIEPWSNFKEIIKIIIPKHTLTYMVDGEEYKKYSIEEGEAIIPETEPTKEGYTFSGWSEIPETMPAQDVKVNGTFSEVISGVVEIGGIYYKLNTITKEAEVIDNPNFYTSNTYVGDIEIISTIKYEDVSYSVTSIKESAFSLCGITSIYIPNSVTSIGKYAFQGCGGLTSVTIPNSVISIGEGAFTSCSGLTSINIPNNITSIEDFCFNDCSGLTSLTIPNNVTSIGKSAFQYCSRITSIIIPNGVNSIASLAFGGCHGLLDIYCYAENVPSTSTDVFGNTDVDNITLHVPAASVNDYKATDPWSRLKGIMAIEGDTPQKCAKPTIDIVDGKLKFSCETEEVEYHYTISNTNPASGVGNDVPFSQTFTITVFASKSGYENSETATAEITASGGKQGDMNNDGLINAADVVKLVNIIMDKE